MHAGNGTRILEMLLRLTKLCETSVNRYRGVAPDNDMMQLNGQFLLNRCVFKKIDGSPAIANQILSAQCGEAKLFETLDAASTYRQRKKGQAGTLFYLKPAIGKIAGGGIFGGRGGGCPELSTYRAGTFQKPPVENLECLKSLQLQYKDVLLPHAQLLITMKPQVNAARHAYNQAETQHRGQLNKLEQRAGVLTTEVSNLQLRQRRKRPQQHGGSRSGKKQRR